MSFYCSLKSPAEQRSDNLKYTIQLSTPLSLRINRINNGSKKRPGRGHWFVPNIIFTNREHEVEGKREGEGTGRIERSTRSRDVQKAEAKFGGCSVLFVPFKLSVKLPCVVGEALSLI